MIMYTPPVRYFVLQAAGIKKGASQPGKEIAGIITLKHVYEIAKIKSSDIIWKNKPLQSICTAIIATCHSMGIQIRKSISDEELMTFYQEREKVVAEQEAKVLAEKQAKLTRALIKNMKTTTNNMQRHVMQLRTELAIERQLISKTTAELFELTQNAEPHDPILNSFNKSSSGSKCTIL
ncbi:39S ribosomal protein L11, mitochondrial [Intoshia linei]|uniref:Large ribosomal subunit protein uL11m n=1 Tax=Intoshia linei TaxID=1819745 RepID=A0A177AZK8_9BILA|nr:39S ribosomal protein L11, mitochondrial [Intoshia linei]